MRASDAESSSSLTAMRAGSKSASLSYAWTTAPTRAKQKTTNSKFNLFAHALAL